MAIVALFAALLGLYIAYDSNKISHDANNISQRANDLADDANAQAAQGQQAAANEAGLARQADVIVVWLVGVQGKVEACKLTAGPFLQAVDAQLQDLQTTAFRQLADGAFDIDQQERYVDQVAALVPESCRSGIDAIPRAEPAPTTSTLPPVSTTSPPVTVPTTGSIATPTSASTPVATTLEPPVALPDGPWGLQVAADTSLEAAEFEAQHSSPGYATLIYRFGGGASVWRTVVVGFSSESDARSAKDSVNDRFQNAFPVDLATNCPTPVDVGSYIDCQ